VVVAPAEDRAARGQRAAVIGAREDPRRALEPRHLDRRRRVDRRRLARTELRVRVVAPAVHLAVARERAAVLAPGRELSDVVEHARRAVHLDPGRPVAHLALRVAPEASELPLGGEHAATLTAEHDACDGSGERARPARAIEAELDPARSIAA